MAAAVQMHTRLGSLDGEATAHFVSTINGLYDVLNSSVKKGKFQIVSLM